MAVKVNNHSISYGTKAPQISATFPDRDNMLELAIK